MKRTSIIAEFGNLFCGQGRHLGMLDVATPLSRQPLWSGTTGIILKIEAKIYISSDIQTCMPLSFVNVRTSLYSCI